MKQCLPPFALAIVLASSSFSYASDAPPFSAGLSKDIINPDYDYLTHCIRDCQVPERQISVEFWNNIITGASNAEPTLALTENTQLAARFLTQSTFGPTALGINELADAIEAEGEYAAMERWLDEQMAQPTSLLTDLVVNETDHLQATAWWHQSLTAPDQLRQRIAFALNHVMTISWGGALTKDGTLVEYYDLLAKNAFGDYRQLLHDITYSIGMSIFLDNIKNDSRYQANENYARELMQLFTLGTERLNMDGTPQLDSNGQPIATYTEADVVELAKALSGFKRGGRWYGEGSFASKRHFQGEKTLFANTAQEVTLAGTSPDSDVEQALDAIFHHPNVAPFLATRLIQHLVTSNPSPAYVERVALTFEANAEGIRGDMAAVVRAVLMDEEARNPEGLPDTAFYGKLKAPVLRLSNLLRAFELNPHSSTAGLLQDIQKPLYAPSVFSFFQPDDTQRGTIATAEKVAPEFNLVTDVNQARLHNAFYQVSLEDGYPGKTVQKGKINKLQLEREAQLAVTDPAALIDRYNLLLMGGSMSDNMKQKLVSFIDQLPAENGDERARKALYLVMSANQQAIQR